MAGGEKATMGLRLISVNGVFFDGRCVSVTLPCVDGEMGILAHHEEMFVAISEGMIRIKKPDDSVIEAVVGIGSAQISNNRCIILVDTAERPEDIDKKRAKDALDLAQEQMRQKQSLREYKMSQAAMARALNRLKSAAKYDI